MKNLSQMLKQAQAVQTKMAEMNDRLAATEIEGTAGGGLVRITLNGKAEMRKIAIDAKAVDPSDVAMLEDLVIAAYNDAKAKVDQHAAAEMQKITGGMSLPQGLSFVLNAMASVEIERLVQILARLPGLGPRSARRAVLQLLKKREALMRPLAVALEDAAEKVHACSACGNLDTQDPCVVCRDQTRDAGLICVVEDVADLWALERAGIFKGRYHVLGGVLSALEGVGPEDLNIAPLVDRTRSGAVREVVLATSATVDGQTTAHYVTERLKGISVTVTRLAHGVPVGGELDYLDEGTLAAALKARRPF